MSISRRAAHEPRSRVRPLSEIAQLLESVDDAPSRVRRALRVLHELVVYDCCALLEAEPGAGARVTIEPEAASPEAVGGALRRLFAQVSGPTAPSPGRTRSRPCRRC